MTSTHTLPLHSKDLLPQSRRDCSLFLFMTSAVAFFLVWELLIVVPHYHDGFNVKVAFHACAGLFIVFNIFGNVFFMKRIDVTGKQLSLPAVLHEGWTYCYVCQMNSPPRAHHCSLCNECILKRDHHCMFTGCCIGYFNHRYYMMALLYLFFGAQYSAYYQWDFCLSFVNGSGLWALLAVVAPHMGILAGALNIKGFLVISIHTLALVTIIMTGYLLLTQCLCIRMGQTPYERREQIYTYKLASLKRNVIEVLGENWHKTWLSAWIESKLPGDGITYTTSNQFEEIKNM